MITVNVVSFKPPCINRDDVLKYAGIGKENPISKELTDEAISEVMKLDFYRACYAELPVKVDEGHVDFVFTSVSSRDLARRLSGCTHALIVATTLGISADRLIRRYMKTSPAKAYLINSACTERVEALTDTLAMALDEKYAKDGMSLTRRFSPGYGDLGIEFQKEIFALISPEKHLGVTLSEGLLMTPSKSVTAIIGLKPQI